MQKSLFAIKIISTILMIGAIGLELSHIYALKNNLPIPSIMNPIFWLERIAVGVHLVEGIVGAFKAGSKDKIWYKYGVYTFFVGTIGLMELFAEEDKSIKIN